MKKDKSDSRQKSLFDDPIPPVSPSRWLKANGAVGIVSKEEVVELRAGVRRVYELMSDGEWHNANEIRAAAQGSEGTKRLREMKAAGHPYEKRLVAGSKRLWEYRLLEKVDD